MDGRRALSTREQFDLSLYWFGLNFHWGALIAVIIPWDILRFVPDSEKGHALAWVLAAGAAIAMVTMPFAGALSDRAQFAMGRRRPFMIVGGILNVIALVLLSRSSTLATFVGAYYLVQFSNNFGGSAYSGLIPDLVPAEQRGAASGWMGLMTMLGTIAGLGASGLLIRQHRTLAYGLIIAVLLVTLVYGVRRVREARPVPAEPLNLGKMIRGFWVSPREYPDFAWLFVSRILVLMGFYTMLAFAQYFLKDYMGFATDFEIRTSILGVVMTLGALPSAYAAGQLSDRSGRRWIVSVAGVIMAASIALFLATPSYTLLLLLAVVFGFGYGAFTSVDWALAIDVLPSRDTAGKDLGIWGIAATVPQVLAPLIGGPLLDTFNLRQANSGYIVIFSVAAVYLAMGSVLVWRIKGTR